MLRRHRPTAALLAGAATAAVLVTGCSSDPYEHYCGLVEQHRTELSDTLGRSGRAGLIAALPILTDLRDAAPDDVHDEWGRVVGSLEGLRDAVVEAGADPATYDPAKPPADVSAEEQAAIAKAAGEVSSQETQQALAAVEQQVRDVCHTPLTL